MFVDPTFCMLNFYIRNQILQMMDFYLINLKYTDPNHMDRQMQNHNLDNSKFHNQWHFFG